MAMRLYNRPSVAAEISGAILRLIDAGTNLVFPLLRDTIEPLIGWIIGLNAMAPDNRLSVHDPRPVHSFAAGWPIKWIESSVIRQLAQFRPIVFVCDKGIFRLKRPTSRPKHKKPFAGITSNLTFNFV